MRLKPPRRRKSIVVRSDRPIADGVNQIWSMDFMADNLADGRKIRLLTIVDNYSRECLALEVGSGFKRHRRRAGSHAHRRRARKAAFHSL